MIGSLNIICNWYFSLAVLALTISFTKFSLATNTLEIGQSITDGQTLVSAGENFVLGFFSPGNSSNRYVGVWYYKVPEQTVIWVANGRNPIPNKNSGVLTITRDGSFMILDSSRGSSYLLAIGSSLKNPSAKILDTGNLVFGETNPDGNEGKILWQSFDYPTDSLLPYMKLVLNKSTGENHFLTSWRSAEDPAPGEYAFGVDTNDNINIWKNGISQWKSRARSGQIFTAAPDSSSSYILNFSSPSDEKLGSYSYTTNNKSVITRLVISMTGQMNRFSWSVSRQMWIIYWEQPKRGCNVSSLCGAYGICSESAFPTCECLEGFEPASVRDWSAGVWSVGCKRKIKLRCGENRSVDDGDDVFVKLSKVGFGKAQPQPLRIGGSQEECKVACMRNCSCFAYAYEKGCYVWEGDLFNLQQLQDGDETGRDIYLRVARERKEAPTSSDPSSLRKGGRNKRLLWIMIGVIIPIISIILISIFMFYLKRRTKDKASHRWVRFAATRKVEELSLVLPDEPFPSSLFECQTLSHLILEQGVFYFNGEFGGFKSLVTLCLEDVRIDKDVLNMMISECDLLENLKVADCRFGVMLLPKICAKNSPRLRNLEIIFDGTELRGIEVVAPGVLFSSSRAGLRVPPWSYPRLSWEADAEGWRCRESSISCVKQKNLLIGDWLLRVQLGVSSFLYMRNMGRTFFCRFHISSSNK
ncbi:hypothetical protein MRB53_021430 [Persea americana]|uniref:Uncharacterized protein n=1 Tax=Persea americana TaxID=3435 RepID=A0ACC2L502_PERAE|nr:hypothetical protein MRB53_021430 [Persea americana]